jgi:hypothetical protein
MSDHDLKKIDEMFQHHIGILNENFQHKLDLVVNGHQMLAEKAENFQHKLDLVVEGHQMLAEKINHVEVRLDQRMDGLERKICEVHVGLSKEIDAVAADLKEHRADTEAHKKIYKVKEE